MERMQLIKPTYLSVYKKKQPISLLMHFNKLKRKPSDKSLWVTWLPTPLFHNIITMISRKKTMHSRIRQSRMELKLFRDIIRKNKNIKYFKFKTLA